MIFKACPHCNRVIAIKIGVEGYGAEDSYVEQVKKALAIEDAEKKEEAVWWGDPRPTPSTPAEMNIWSQWWGQGRLAPEWFLTSDWFVNKREQV